MPRRGNGKEERKKVGGKLHCKDDENVVGMDDNSLLLLAGCFYERGCLRLWEKMTLSAKNVLFFLTRLICSNRQKDAKHEKGRVKKPQKDYSTLKRVAHKHHDDVQMAAV